jgi:hypothetical protein
MHLRGADPADIAEGLAVPRHRHIAKYRYWMLAALREAHSSLCAIARRRRICRRLSFLRRTCFFAVVALVHMAVAERTYVVRADPAALLLCGRCNNTEQWMPRDPSTSSRSSPQTRCCWAVWSPHKSKSVRSFVPSRCGLTAATRIAAALERQCWWPCCRVRELALKWPERRARPS